MSNSTFKIQIEIPYTLDEMIHAAQMAGFKRENARKAWTEKDKREAARWVAERCLNHVMRKEYGK